MNRFDQAGTVLPRACAAAAAVVAIVFSSLPANAEKPPWEGCRLASKVEYDSARQQHLLRSRVGMYVKTGPIWKRSYWYCHL